MTWYALHRAVMVGLLSSTFPTSSGAQRPDTTAIAIRAGRLIDPATGTVARDQVILVRGGKVVAVGGNVSIPQGTQILDLSRETVLPGLFDAHTYLCMTVRMRRDAGSYYYTTLNDPESVRAVDGVVNARDMLQAGFTTVRDVGNEGNYACTGVRRAIDLGRIPGPTILNAGRIIAPYGGQFQLQPEKKEHLAVPEYYFADTRDELLKALRENVHYGARVIKLVVDDQPYIYSIDDLRFVVEEARRMNLRVATHVWTREGAHNAAAAGVASLEHLNGISDEDLELARKNGVVAVFTPFPEWVLRQFRDTLRATDEYKQELDRLRAGVRIGVPIAFGSDAIHDLAGHDRGTLAVSWVDSYKAAGMSPKAILQAMTINAARLLGVDAERGAIRPGMAADIIATPADPSEDIGALKRVNFVMKDGRLVRRPARTAR
jgi:imidazolonepropionase-like amidohydrolase